jgi:hypothetical protein
MLSVTEVGKGGSIGKLERTEGWEQLVHWVQKSLEAFSPMSGCCYQLRDRASAETTSPNTYTGSLHQPVLPHSMVAYNFSQSGLQLQRQMS